MQLPMAPTGAAIDLPTAVEDLPALKREVRELARERNAVILAHNEAATCRFMKTIKLPKLRDCLRDLTGDVRVPAEIADRARVPIERTVAIG